MAKLFNPKSPRLPSPPVTYDERFFNQHDDVLRLYFNQLDNALAALLGTRGGQYVNNPYGAFSSTQTQTVSTINTPTRVTLNTTDFANGTSFVAGDGIHVEQDGVYNLQFSVQATNTDTQDHEITFWLRQGTGSGAPVDLPYTASVATIPSSHGGVAGHYILAANFYVEMTGVDFVEAWWAATSTQVKLETLPAITSPYTRPGSPAVVVTLSFVSSLPT